MLSSWHDIWSIFKGYKYFNYDQIDYPYKVELREKFLVWGLECHMILWGIVLVACRWHTLTSRADANMTFLCSCPIP